MSESNEAFRGETVDECGDKPKILRFAKNVALLAAEHRGVRRMNEEALGDVADIADETPPTEISRGVPCEIEPGWFVVIVFFDDKTFRLFDETYARYWDPSCEDALLAIKRSLFLPEIIPSGDGEFVVSGEDHAGFYNVSMRYDPKNRLRLENDKLLRI